MIGKEKDQVSMARLGITEVFTQCHLGVAIAFIIFLILNYCEMLGLFRF
jgi:hypothetical protein